MGHHELRTDLSGRHERRAGVMLLAGAISCLVAAGGLLWWRYGGAVFNDMVLSALAWCF